MSNPRSSKLRADRGPPEADVNNTISFKYTVDYPKIELHPFDTKKFSIFYNDHATDGSGRGGGNGSGIDYFSVNLNSKNDDDSMSQSSSGMMSGKRSSANQNRQGQSRSHQLHHFEKKLDLRTLSRESRDLICLTIKCFAAQSYFINSKIIDMVEDQQKCRAIKQQSKYPSAFGLSASQISDDNYRLSDVLLEMEFLKHDLNK